jgi:hypothetical protein
MRPLAIDLYCGLGGWTEGLLLEGYRVVGFDIEQHVYGEARYPAQLVLQDVLTLHGRQFADAALIVASPPCQAYSYRAMPWKRAKALPPPDNSLFEACFRIQREACEAAGRPIPLVVENVCGAQKWVGRARWHYGSFYLWGDVPALMPMTRGIKNHGGSWFNIAHNTTSGHGQNPDGRKISRPDGIKVPGNKLSDNGFTIPIARTIDKSMKQAGFRLSDDDRRQHLSFSRKAASAHIAKIPLVLARWIARAWWPTDAEAIA